MNFNRGKLYLTPIYSLIILVVFQFHASSQKNDSIPIIESDNKGKIFSNIYTGFYFKSNENKNSTGFALSTGLIGYEHKINDKLTGTIILDVTRTTNNIQVTDTSGNNLYVSFFEGSKFTAFLKMAEIKWKFHKMFTLSAGQLLNTQYLTLQDKFWAHRYVEFTFQEVNRFGNPADFGIRFKFEPSEKLAIDAGAFNGEGPFRVQDSESDFLLSLNFEYKPIKALIFKFYYANQAPYNIDSLNSKNIYSAFAGFDKGKFRIGLEYDYVQHANFLAENWSGLSAFTYYQLNKQFELFYRYDYINKSALYENTAYHIAGIQYKPYDSFFMSVNYRYFSHLQDNMIYLNLGLKF